MSILKRIIDAIEPPMPYFDAWSDETRSKVKQAFASLGKEGQTARIEHHWKFGRVLAIRPQDVGKLTEQLAARNLMTDSLVQGMLGVLKDEKEHFVRFAIENEG